MPIDSEMIELAKKVAVEAIYLEKQGKIQESIEKYRKAVDLIHRFLEKNNSPEIIEMFQVSIDDYQIRANYLESYLITDYNKIIEIGEEIFKKDQNNKMGLNMLSRGHFYLQNDEKAEFYLKKILSLEPMNVKALIMLATIYMEKKDYNKAIEFLQRGQEIEITYENLWRLGDCFFFKEEYERAIECYNKGLQINPQSGYNLHQLGVIYYRWGDYDAAEDFYSQALRRKEDPNTWANLSSVYIYKRDFKRGSEALEKFKAQSEKFSAKKEAFYLWNYGSIFLYKKDYEKALEFYNKALELDPSDESNARYYFKLGYIAYKKGNDITALDYFDKAMELFKKQSSALYYSAKIYLNMGYYAEALDMVEEYLKRSPRSQKAKYLFNKIVNL